MTSNSKEIIRKKIIESRNQLSQQAVVQQAQKIFEQVKSLINKHSPKSIHLYLAINNEVDTSAIVHFLHQNNITVLVPKTYPKGKLEWCILQADEPLKKGMFGTSIPVSENISTSIPEMVLVPAVGFDQQGNRLGYGGGYYDRFLAQYPQAIKVGLAYPFQILETVKTEPHDIPMDIILNGNEIFHRDH